MKKLLSYLAVCIIALSCGTAFTACNFSDPYDRKGERCYINDDNEFVWFRLSTRVGDNQFWTGVENYDYDNDGITDESKCYFIKGDTVRVDAVLKDPVSYYLEDDFEILINGQPVSITRQEGSFIDYDTAEYYYTGTFVIQSNVAVEANNVHENVVECAITAESYEQLYEKRAQEWIEFNPEITEENLRQLFYDYYINENDDGIRVRFEDKDIFSLPKAEWSLPELNEYVAAQDGQKITGNVKVVSGTYIYIFTKGYTRAVTWTCLRVEESEPDNNGYMTMPGVSAFSFGYVNEADNEYGIKYKLDPEPVDAYSYADGTICLVPDKADEIAVAGYGNLRESQLVSEDDIINVPNINPLYEIKFNGTIPPGHIGDYSKIPFDYLDDNNQVLFKMNLLRYSEPEWRELYDKMTLKISDVTLEKGVDYTISSNGVITAVLGRPYEYFDPAAHYDEDDLSYCEINADYMYTYSVKCDLVLLAKKAGLLTSMPYAPNTTELIFGNETVGPIPLWDGNVGSYLIFPNVWEVEQHILYVSDNEVILDFDLVNNYNKLTITDKNGNEYTIDVRTYHCSEDDLPNIRNDFKNEDYAGDVAVFAKYVLSDADEYASYFIKFLAGTAPAKLRFHN
ncbi:MAG: hypothetical protein K2H30_01785 [Clostridia bacterium]|nr:hypothetical protein [Clostridia bacterium]